MSAFAFKPVTRAGFMLADSYPSNWQNRRLRFVCDLNPSKRELVGIDSSTSVSFVPMEKVSHDGNLTLDDERPIELVYNGFTFFADGDVVVAKITPCFENGKGAECRDLKNGYGFGTTEFHVLRPRNIDSRFLYYVTACDAFRKIGATEMSGAAGQKRVPETFLQNLILPLPPLALQRRIAAFLDRETANIDTLVAEKESLLRLLEEKRSSLISQAVTRGLNSKAKLKPSRIPWLGEVPENWEVMKLRYLASHVTSGSRGWSRFYSPSGDKFIRIGNLRRGSIKMDLDDIQHVMLPSDGSGESAERARLRMNDVLFSITAYLGSVGICPVELEGAYVSQHVALVRLKSSRILSTWLGYYALGRSGQIQLNEASYGGTKLQLSLDDIREFTLPVPPIDEQRGIVDFLEQNTSNIDSLVVDIQTSIHLLREKRTSLISAAVTGQMAIA